MARGTYKPLTTNSANERHARWSFDGRRVLFQSNRDGGVYQLYEKPSSGAGTEELLFRDSQRKYPTDWSSDGKFVAYTGFGSDAGTTADLWILPMAMGRRASADTLKPVPYLRTGFHETQARISPDMRWMAYVSNESTREEVYISTFPTFGDLVQVSKGGGGEPRWRSDGKELFYLSSDGRIMAVPLGGGPTLDVGASTALFSVHRRLERGYSSSPYRPYCHEVKADGQRFVVNVPTAGGAFPITVVLNWTAGLKK
jgi:Tol biopolymer transport system component